MMQISLLKSISQPTKTYTCIPELSDMIMTQLTNKECDQINPRSRTCEFSGSDVIPVSFIQDDMVKDDDLISLYVTKG